MTLTLPATAWSPRGLAVLIAVAVALAAGLWLVPAPAPAPAADAATPGPPTVAALAAGDPKRSVEVVVRLRGAEASRQGPALVRAHGGRITRDLRVIGAYGARMSAGEAQRLAADPSVQHVSLDRVVRTSSSTAAARTT